MVNANHVGAQYDDVDQLEFGRILRRKSVAEDPEYPGDEITQEDHQVHYNDICE